MTEITWTGAESTDFLDAGNWDVSTTPGFLDDVFINNAVANTPVVSTVASIASLEIGADLRVTGQLLVSGLTNVTGFSATLEFEAGSSSTLAQLEIGAFAVVTNSGNLVIGGLAASSGTGEGQLQNFGTLQLGGEMRGSLQNSGQVTIGAETTISGYDTVSFDAELRLNAALNIGFGRHTFGGAMEVTFSGNPLAQTGVFADGVLAIGLDSLVVDTTLAGAMSVGSERNLFHTSITAIDAFSVADFSVIGQHADFAYALRVIGIENFSSGVSLLALNSGATGGRAVLDQGASSRAVTLSINSRTGEGTIHGGSFAHDHASLLHGVDEVRGSSGNDSLSVTAGTAGFTFAGNGGDDTLQGGIGNDVLNGGSGDDSLIGGAGNDQLNGGIGTDAMAGGAGNDIYYISVASDVIQELSGGGVDQARTTVSYILATQVENALAIGSASINLTGNALENILTGNGADNALKGGLGNDKLYGGAGNDILNGGLGIDTMSGGDGNDLYYVNDILDRVIDSLGFDHARSSVTYTLTSGIEVGSIIGTDAVGMNGNALANRLTGNAAGNRLNGSLGDDTLTGGGGNDTLFGGAGSDVLVFKAGDGQDRVIDFVAFGTGSDRLDFHGHAQIVNFADLSANHMVQSGSNVVISSGTDRITLIGVNLTDLDAGDFLF